MSAYGDAFSKTNENGRWADTSGFNAGQFPHLADALVGVWDEEKKSWSRKPATISVWVDGSVVKICVGIDDKAPKWFWSCDSLEAYFEQAEAALAANKGNWWFPTERKRR